jgi:CheY-like chemotaxis protein
LSGCPAQTLVRRVAAQETGTAVDASRELQALNFSQVLVVGKSPVNRIVIGKIAERCGLKPISETPEQATAKLSSLKPGMVILDAGATSKDCERVLVALRDRRRASGKNLPRVILLWMASGDVDARAASQFVDAMVAMPMTTETLQPVIDRLLAEAQK